MDNIVKFIYAIISVLILFGGNLLIIPTEQLSRHHGHHTKCHLVELQQCFQNLHQLKDPKHDPSFLLTSSKGLDKLCRVVKENFAGCILNYIKRCGTPLHKELSKALSDAILDHMNSICDPVSNLRNEIIEKSSCIYEKVLSQQDYQQECNNPFFITVSWSETKAHGKVIKYSPIDYLIDGGCCAYNQWEKCTMPKVRTKCDNESENVLRTIIAKLLGGITGFICSEEFFHKESKICTLMPSLNDQLAQTNLTKSDNKPFSLFALLKMFLVRTNIK